MIRIAVCDDEVYICTLLEDMLTEILREKDVQFEIDTFSSGESLCRELERRDFDIMFLDIELPEVSGIDVGRYIRETLKNEIVQIAYISAKEGYAMELFEFRPINFLVKPLEKEKVARVMEKYFIITEQDNHVFEYKKRMEYYKVPMSEILYFESRGRKVEIHMSRGRKDEFYASMEKVYDAVKKHDFLFIHQSVIVNYRFIKKISYEEAVMVDGTILSISQSRRKAIKSMYMKIRKGEMSCSQS